MLNDNKQNLVQKVIQIVEVEDQVWMKIIVQFSDKKGNPTLKVTAKTGFEVLLSFDKMLKNITIKRFIILKN